jgi:hypothetical protein
MSLENLDLTRRAFEYLERTGEVLPEAFHPNIVLSLTKFPGAILPGNFVGVEEINEWLAEWLGAFEDWSFDIEEVFDSGIRWSQSSANAARPSTAARRWRCASHRSARFGTASSRKSRCTPTGTKPSKTPGCGSRRFYAELTVSR